MLDRDDADIDTATEIVGDDAGGETRAASVASVITAAGSGTRMGTRKQFLELAPGERIIDRVVATCRATTGWVGLVIPPGTAWDGIPVDAVIEGGSDRLASVAAGVAALPPEMEVVVVHSASHPLASTELVRRLVAEVEGGVDGAVPVLAAVDVIKRRRHDGTVVTVGRDGLGTAQAPMAWSRPVLDRALAGATDGGARAVEESSAVEAIGGRVVAVDGEATNLHVTDRASLEMIRRLADLVSLDSDPWPPPRP